MARDMLKYSSVFFLSVSERGLMVCAFTHQSCFWQKSKIVLLRFQRSSLRAWAVSSRRKEAAPTDTRRGFRVTDLTHPCYMWLRVEHPGQSQSPVGDHTSPMVSRDPLPWWEPSVWPAGSSGLRNQLRVTPGPWSRHTLFCSLRTEDDSG